MFDNVNWNNIINSVITYIKKDWTNLTFKFFISKRSYSDKYYYSMDGKNFIDLYKDIDVQNILSLSNSIRPELKKIMENIEDDNGKMFLTMKAEMNGNVKIIHRYVKEGEKIPFDEKNKYLGSVE